MTETTIEDLREQFREQIRKIVREELDTFRAELDLERDHGGTPINIENFHFQADDTSVAAYRVGEVNL